MYAIDLTALDGLDVPQQQKDIIKGQLLSQWRADMSNYEKEYSRYKQDCRKRALDLAIGKFAGLTKDGEDSVTTEADKYYNWLISIPQ